MTKTIRRSLEYSPPSAPQRDTKRWILAVCGKACIWAVATLFVIRVIAILVIIGPRALPGFTVVAQEVQAAPEYEAGASWNALSDELDLAIDDRIFPKRLARVEPGGLVQLRPGTVAALGSDIHDLKAVEVVWEQEWEGGRMVARVSQMSPAKHSQFLVHQLPATKSVPHLIEMLFLSPRELRNVLVHEVWTVQMVQKVRWIRDGNGTRAVVPAWPNSSQVVVELNDHDRRTRAILVVRFDGEEPLDGLDDLLRGVRFSWNVEG